MSVAVSNTALSEYLEESEKLRDILGEMDLPDKEAILRTCVISTRTIW